MMRPAHLLTLSALAAALVAPAAVRAQEMKFPSFNAVTARPQGISANEAAGQQGQPGQPGQGQGSVQGKAAPAAKPEAKAPAKPKPKPVKTAAKADDSLAARASETKGVSIAVLVNDEPITGYEIEQRQRIMGLGANIGEKAQANFKRMLQDPSTSERLKGILGEIIKANPGKSREQILAMFEERKKQFAISMQKQAVESARSSVLPTLKKAALEELIEERLKLQEAKRLGVLASDEDVSRIVRSLAEKNKVTEAQFAQHLAGMGADIESMRQRFRAMLSWNDVIRRKFGHQIAITERDIDRLVSQGPAGEEQVELQVQRITLALDDKINQKLAAQRMADAEAMRGKFKDCKSMAQLAGSVINARFDDLGARRPGSLTEPTRSLLLNAKDGEMVPPTYGPGGVELYAVCGRQVVKADEQKRTAAQEELRQKEFELHAKSHLQNLKQDALICYAGQPGCSIGQK